MPQRHIPQSKTTHADTPNKMRRAKADNSTATFTFTVNGSSHTLSLDPRTTLLDALREHLHLTGTKKGCDQGVRMYERMGFRTVTRIAVYNSA